MSRAFFDFKVKVDSMDNPSLIEISEAIDALIQNRNALVYAGAEFGFDETGLIATRDGYLRLAKELIDFVAIADRGESESWIFGEVKGLGSTRIGELFNFLSEVELDTTFLVGTEEEAEKAAKFFNPHFGK